MIRYSYLPAIVAVCGFCAAAAAGQVSSVYFQVSYANGDVRDLSRVPTTRKGIIRVMRITRIDPPGREVRVLSSYSRPRERLASGMGRTLRAELVWNSRAWVAPAAAAATSRPSAAGKKDQLGDLETALGELRRIEADRQRAVAAAAGKLAAVRDDAQRKAAAAKLALARGELARCRAAISDRQDKLLQLVAAGRVVSGTLSTARSSVAVAGRPEASAKRQVDQAGVFQHRVQVWPLAEAKGKRTVSVAIAHAEAGAFGAFYFVAYADTDGDGVADRLIARSPLAVAQEPGQWSTWTFITDQPRVFVGNTWPRAEASHLRRRRRAGQTPAYQLPDDMYISGYYGAVPTEKNEFWPYIQNIRIRLKPQAVRDENGEPEMIIEQR